MREGTRKYNLLRLIADMGGEGTRDQINEKIPNYWKLSEEDKEIEKGIGKPKYWHRADSQRQALKDRDGYLELKGAGWGGIWKITEAGRGFLSSTGYQKLHQPLPEEKQPQESEIRQEEVINLKTGDTHQNF